MTKQKTKEKLKPNVKSKAKPNAKFSASEHWKGMPEFTEKALAPYQKVVVNIVDEAAALKFFKLIGQPYTKKTRSVWFPEVEEKKYIDKRYTDKPKKK